MKKFNVSFEIGENKLPLLISLLGGEVAAWRINEVQRGTRDPASPTPRRTTTDVAKSKCGQAVLSLFKENKGKTLHTTAVGSAIKKLGYTASTAFPPHLCALPPRAAPARRQGHLHTGLVHPAFPVIGRHAPPLGLWWPVFIHKRLALDCPDHGLRLCPGVVVSLDQMGGLRADPPRRRGRNQLPELARQREKLLRAAPIGSDGLRNIQHRKLC